MCMSIRCMCMDVNTNDTTRCNRKGMVWMFPAITSGISSGYMRPYVRSQFRTLDSCLVGKWKGANIPWATQPLLIPRNDSITEPPARQWERVFITELVKERKYKKDEVSDQETFSSLGIIPEVDNSLVAKQEGRNQTTSSFELNFRLRLPFTIDTLEQVKFPPIPQPYSKYMWKA